MGSADYEFRTVWRVAGTPEEVADVLGDATEFPRWWPSVYLGADRQQRPGRHRTRAPEARGPPHERVAALHASLDPYGHRTRHHPRVRAHRGRGPERHRPLDLRAGRTRNRHHLPLARPGWPSRSCGA